eukprot:556239_1
MAHGLLTEEVEGVETAVTAGGGSLIQDDLKQPGLSRCLTPIPGKEASLVPYLKKYKLPIHKFKSNDMDIDDFINFDYQYFKGLCEELKLNSLESMRFKKLVNEINQISNQISVVNGRTPNIKQQEMIRNIQSDQQVAETTMDTYFETLTDILNNRKDELVQSLKDICGKEINNVSNMHKVTHIHFECDAFDTIKQMLSSMGQVVVSGAHAPTFSLKSPDDPFGHIHVIVNDNVTVGDMRYEIQYKEAFGTSWTSADSLIIRDKVKPLTSYMVRLRRMYRERDDEKERFSEWSAIQEISTDFDCIWNEKYCRNMTLINEHEIFFDGNNLQYCCSSVVTKHCIKQKTFKRIKFEFVIHEYAQPSTFGFVAAPVKASMGNYWKSNKHVLVQNTNACLISVSKGSTDIQCYQNGKEMTNGKFAVFKKGISIPKKIQKGDHFILDINFNVRCCDFYINDDKICTKNKTNMWQNVPVRLFPVYSHYCDIKMVKKSSRVQVNLIEYDLR